MADSLTKEQRSRVMSNIKSINTSLETHFKKLLRKSKIKRYRQHYKIVEKPDFAFPAKKVAIFLDGDFWHGYNWKKLHKVPPKKYWQAKIERTILRDRRYTRNLTKEGWKVLRFWEHEIRRNPEKCLRRIKEML